MDGPRAKEAAEKILADPNSDQLSRDLAHLLLADLPDPSVAQRRTPEDYVKGLCDEWIQIEGYKRGLYMLSDEDAIALAIEALLVQETIQLSAKYNAEGKLDPLLAYPKLVKISKNMIRTNHTNKVHGHVILGFLSRGTDLSEAVQHFSKAIQIQPKDWRLRSQLASTYMMMDNLSLSLQSLLVAIDLCPTEYEKFDLQTRKSKVLFNLDRGEEAKASFEQLLKDSTKYESQMTQKEKGHLAVCQYMLCQLYLSARDKVNAFHHWNEAEAKRNALPPAISLQIDWSSRSIAQMSMGALNPDMLSHQECHNCRKLVKDPKKCSLCKVALYCSKECQVAAWKSGHKRECQQAKTDRKTKKKEQKQAAKAEDIRLPPLDATLDPPKLWAHADKLARKKRNTQEAVFYYLVALFMDFSLDARDKQLARRAMAACEADDPMAIALGMAVNIDRFYPLKTCNKTREDIARIIDRNYFIGVRERGVESFEQIDRFQFGIAMSFIFHGRIIGRCFSVTSYEQAHSRSHKEAFEDIIKLFSEAKVYLDPERWLTFQYELGYSNFDVMATDEAKRWFGLFFSGLESAKRKNGSLSGHWAAFKSKAEQKLSLIPLMEKSAQSGFVP